MVDLYAHLMCETHLIRLNNWVSSRKLVLRGRSLACSAVAPLNTIYNTTRCQTIVVTVNTLTHDDTHTCRPLATRNDLSAGETFSYTVALDTDVIV